MAVNEIQRQQAMNALALAREAHMDVLRRDGKTPYLQHPMAVATTVRTLGAETEVVLAALLHDTVEDGDKLVDWEQRIYQRVGPNVLHLVLWVTKMRGQVGLNDRRPRAMRLGWELERLKHAPEAARLIKLADIGDNVVALSANGDAELKQDDAKWARKWLGEKGLMLDALGRETNPGLWDRVDDLIGKTTEWFEFETSLNMEELTK